MDRLTPPPHERILYVQHKALGLGVGVGVLGSVLFRSNQPALGMVWVLSAGIFGAGVALAHYRRSHDTEQQAFRQQLGAWLLANYNVEATPAAFKRLSRNLGETSAFYTSSDIPFLSYGVWGFVDENLRLASSGHKVSLSLKIDSDGSQALALERGGRPPVYAAIERATLWA